MGFWSWNDHFYSLEYFSDYISEAISSLQDLLWSNCPFKFKFLFCDDVCTTLCHVPSSCYRCLVVSYSQIPKSHLELWSLDWQPLCYDTYCRNVGMIHMTPTHLKCICGLQKCKIPTIHSQHLDCLLNVTIIF